VLRFRSLENAPESARKPAAGRIACPTDGVLVFVFGIGFVPFDGPDAADAWRFGRFVLHFLLFSALLVPKDTGLFSDLHERSQSCGLGARRPNPW
jgi:hypothetical protein